MRILHLSTSTLGGAGVVASRIIKMQEKDNHVVHLMTLNNAGNPGIGLHKRSKVRRFMALCSTALSFIGTDKKWTQLTTVSVSAKTISKIDEFKPDIIHIHNWFNLLSLNDLSKILVKYPTIFHIHDSRLMTGGCHYTFDCISYLDGCKKCPATLTKRSFVNKSFKDIEKLFSRSKPYGLIFPSNWLQERFITSSISKNSKVITTTLNPIDLETINSIKSTKTSSIVCVISELSAHVKGFDLFLDSLERVSEDLRDYCVKVIGGNPTSNQRSRISRLGIELLGRLSNVDTLKVIASSKLLVVPSFSENSPTVILEAQLLGTPVLATAIEGCLELIQDGVTGLICETTPEDLAIELLKALKSDHFTPITENARNLAVMKQGNILMSIYDTYDKVITSHTALVGRID